MPEYPPAYWWDEWPEPRVPLGVVQMKYASKPVPEGAKFHNTLSACGGDRKFEDFASLFAPYTISRKSANIIPTGRF